MTTKAKTPHEVLAAIQSEIKAPKGQTNEFGGYKYRSLEDITEAAKPLLAKHSAALIMSDEVIEIAGRVYVKATATLHAAGGEISNAAMAREPLSKKGSDESQITGAASSYARKYALNGLFAIDDTKDADSHDNRQQGAVATVNGEQASTLREWLEPAGKKEADICHAYQIESLDALSAHLYGRVLERLQDLAKGAA